MAEFVNASELARRMGVSEGAIRKSLKRGLLRRHGSGTNKGLFDVDASKAAYENDRDPDAALRGVAGGLAVSTKPVTNNLPENSLTRARTAQATLKAQREQIGLLRLKGELIRTEDAYRAIMAVVSIVTERLDGAAAQIGARVVGLDAVAAERVARDILANVRKEIAGMSSAIQVVANEQK